MEMYAMAMAVESSVYLLPIGITNKIDNYNSNSNSNYRYSYIHDYNICCNNNHNCFHYIYIRTRPFSAFAA